MAAGRAMLERLTQLASERKSFGFETTLASRSFAPKIRTLLHAGYEFHLVFLSLPSPDLAVERVASRVRLGGHDVPEDTIRRRYRSGLRNFFALYSPLATSWRMYDNSTAQPRLIASGSAQRAPMIDDEASWHRITTEGRRGE
jgi:predicted ABC-type ATPase